jgi:Protein kinase domain
MTENEGDNHVRFSGLGLDRDEEVAAISELNASSSTRKLESPPPPPEVVERLSPIPNPSRAESDEDVPPDRNGEAFHEGGGNTEHVNGNSVGRVSFTAPAIAEIHIIEEPAHVHFAESIPDDDGSVEQEIVHRKLDSPPPTPEVLESLSPVPSGSSSENLSLIMLPFEGEATKSGHVCFAPRLEVVEPTHEELSVHFSQPKPDDTLNHDGPHRNIESPPPPPEVVDLIKSAIPDDEKTSSDGVVEKEQLQPPELNDFEDDGAPHVRFSASPQVVEFIQVEHAHVHFSDPAVDDATTDSEGDRSRKLESPPPPLEAVRLSPTPDDLKNKEVLLLPIDEKDKSDGNGPHVHFSVAPQVVESIDPFHVHFSNPVSNVTLEHVVPLRKLESPPPPPEIEEVLSSKSSFLDESDVTPAIVDKADGHVHFSPKQQVVEIDQPENIRVSFSSPSMDDNLDHDGPHSRLESPPPPSDELRHSPLLRQGDKRDQTKAAAAAVEIWPATSRVVKFEQCNPEVISRDNLSSSLISDASVDENPEVSLTSTSTPDVTNSGRSSASSMRSGVRRFASKELRGNLTRRQIDRNPLEYYEIVDVLGEGSMGSVAKVRKRFSSTGAKSRQTAVEPTTETTTNRCFNLPLVGGLFRYCLKGSREDAITEPKEVRRSVSASFDELDLHASSQIMYAMKSIHLSRCTDQTLVDELKNEVEMLKTLDHPHIVRAMETFEYKNQLFVTMELCSGGDLYTHDPYTEEEAARITMAILSAVSYMHSKGM